MLIKKPLKKMIMEEKISYQLQKEGVFDDYMKRAKQKGTTAQSFAAQNANLRSRVDKILGNPVSQVLPALLAILLHRKREPQLQLWLRVGT